MRRFESSRPSQSRVGEVARDDHVWDTAGWRLDRHGFLRPKRDGPHRVALPNTCPAARRDRASIAPARFCYVQGPAGAAKRAWAGLPGALRLMPPMGGTQVVPLANWLTNTDHARYLPAQPAPARMVDATLGLEIVDKVGPFMREA